jgi:hypothetical protein
MKISEIRWDRAAAEFAVIVIGVLVALAVDGWNQTRGEMALESDYLNRLSADVRADSAMQEFLLTAFSEKASALEQVESVIEGGGRQPEDAASFLEALARAGTAFAWGLPALQSVTFDDLTDTGRIGFLRDSSLRAQIIRYYKNGNHRLGRMTARHTDYPTLIYQIIPPEVLAHFPQTDPRAPGELARGNTTSAEPPQLNPTEWRELMAALQELGFRRALNAERNYAVFGRTQVGDNLDEASALLRELGGI